MSAFAVDRALQGMEAVLLAIDGVGFVDRQAMQQNMLPDSKLVPGAVLISCQEEDWQWSRGRRNRFASGGKGFDVGCAINLDCQILPARLNWGIGSNVQTVRSAFVEAIIQAIASNPTLPLEGVDTVTDSARRFQVRHVYADQQKARSIITLSIEVEADADDSREVIDWQTIVGEGWRDTPFQKDTESRTVVTNTE